LMADGSCRPISWNVSQLIFSSICNKGEGNTVTLE